MADIILSPEKFQIPGRDDYKGGHGCKTMFPKVGNHYAVIYLEASPANATRINALLNQAKALAVTEQMVRGLASAEDGCRPSVKVRVDERINAPLEQ